MRIEKKNDEIVWRGELNPKYLGDGSPTNYQLSPSGDRVLISLYSGGSHNHLFADSLPHLLNFYRDLGDVLNHLQPGLTLPLPDGDAEELEAIKISWRADQLRRGIL